MSEKSDQAVEEELSFSGAMAELERILKGVEDEEIDIDFLGKELARAAELLEVCRAKIRRAETEVNQIVQSLQEGPPEAASEAVDSEASAGGEEPAGEESGGEEELPF